MHIDIVEPGATDTSRTLWRFAVVFSYGERLLSLKTNGKLVQYRDNKRCKWRNDTSNSYDPSTWVHRDGAPPRPPFAIATAAADKTAEMVTKELHRMVREAYAVEE